MRESRSYFPLWASIDPLDRNSLALQVAGFGAAYLGVQLSVLDMKQTENPQTLHVCSRSITVTMGILSQEAITVITCRAELTQAGLIPTQLIWPQFTLVNGLFYRSSSDLETLKAQNAIVVLRRHIFGGCLYFKVSFQYQAASEILFASGFLPVLNYERA